MTHAESAGAEPGAGIRADEPILRIEGLRVVHPQRSRSVQGHHEKGGIVAVDGVSLSIDAGEVVALIGESGSGKSSLALAAAGLGRISGGRVELLGADLSRLRGRARREGCADVQVVFQDPVASLDPRQRVDRGLAELRRIHPRRSAGTTDVGLLERVGLPADILRRYPAEMSGGQAQRVVIARALLLRPRLLLADEPTSALDVSVQAQILRLILGLAAEEGIAVLLVTHDLSIVRHTAERLYVMRRGVVVEEGDSETVLTHPHHEYTRALIEALPGKSYAPAWRIGRTATFGNQRLEDR
jgi:ABC-type glutathione transport system ATPase component